MAPFITSPLKYPGGKFNHLHRIFPVFPTTLNTLVSPFFGGGSIEMNLALRGTRIIGSDVNPQIVNFYNHFFDNPKRMHIDADNLVRNHYVKIKKEKYGWVHKQEYDGYADAVLCYAYNRLSYGGKIQGHYLSLIHI